MSVFLFSSFILLSNIKNGSNAIFLKLPLSYKRRDDAAKFIRKGNTALRLFFGELMMLKDRIFVEPFPRKTTSDTLLLFPMKNVASGDENVIKLLT